MAIKKVLGAVAAARAADAAAKAKADAKATRAAVEESSRIRAMFDRDREAFAKRYGVVR